MNTAENRFNSCHKLKLSFYNLSEEVLAIYKINHREKEMSDNKHLIVCQGEELEIFQYVRKISDSDVAYNLHLMEFKHKVEDDDIMYYYTIGDRVSLRQMAETKGVKRNFKNSIKKDFIEIYG